MVGLLVQGHSFLQKAGDYPGSNEGIEAVSCQLDGLLCAPKQPLQPGSLPCCAVCLIIPADTCTSTFIAALTRKAAGSVKATTHPDSVKDSQAGN